MVLFGLWAPRKASKRARPRAEAADKRRANAPPAERENYDAVEIRMHVSACKRARALAGKRFLVAEAPRLPLEGCNVRCKCSYKSHPDRRQEPRRSADVGMSSRFYVGPERRSGLDRRLNHAGDDDYYGYMRRR